MWNFKNHHPIAENIQYDKLLQGNEIQNIHPVQCELFTEIGEGILKLQPIIDPVSYTHLDVYKRQRHHFLYIVMRLRHTTHIRAHGHFIYLTKAQLQKGGLHFLLVIFLSLIHIYRLWISEDNQSSFRTCLRL